MNKNGILAFFVWVLIVQAACTESKKIAATPTENTSQSEDGKLVFVNLLFVKTPEGKDSCSVINSIVTDGTLRDQESPQVRNRGNYYTLFFNSCEGKTVYKEEIDNQLDTQVEVYNESGPIELKEISFKQREYSIRMQKGTEKICRLVVIKTTKGQTETICNHLISL